MIPAWVHRKLFAALDTVSCLREIEGGTGLRDTARAHPSVRPKASRCILAFSFGTLQTKLPSHLSNSLAQGLEPLLGILHVHN